MTAVGRTSSLADQRAADKVCPIPAIHGTAQAAQVLSNRRPSRPSGGMPGAPLGSGRSATIASEVIINPATEAASCSATRTVYAHGSSVSLTANSVSGSPGL